MTISYAQGAAIKMALTEETKITLDTGMVGNIALEYFSGTSMAAPAAGEPCCCRPSASIGAIMGGLLRLQPV
jgi:hypothetical protein